MSATTDCDQAAFTLSIAARLVLCEAGEAREHPREEEMREETGVGKLECLSNRGGWFLNQVRSVAGRRRW